MSGRWAQFSLAVCLLSLAGTPQSLLPGLRFKKFVCPTYPKTAQMCRLEGTVVLELIVNKKGVPTDIRVLEGHPLLVSAAIEAARQWRYMPYRLNHEAVEISVREKLRFTFQPPSGPRCRILPSSSQVPTQPPHSQKIRVSDSSGRILPRN